MQDRTCRFSRNTVGKSLGWRFPRRPFCLDPWPSLDGAIAWARPVRGAITNGRGYDTEQGVWVQPPRDERGRPKKTSRTRKRVGRAQGLSQALSQSGVTNRRVKGPCLLAFRRVPSPGRLGGFGGGFRAGFCRGHRLGHSRGHNTRQVMVCPRSGVTLREDRLPGVRGAEIDQSNLYRNVGRS
jgi:hypothetical protein